MSKYKCKCCSYKEKGDFAFITYYTGESGDSSDATRCPKCGALVSTKDVVKL